MKKSALGLTAIFCLAMMFVVACKKDKTETPLPTPEPTPANQMKDKAGKAYKTVVIGEQTWMAENLDYNVEGSMCAEDGCPAGGRLYNSEQLSNLAPEGWRVPTNGDWE